MYEFEVWNKEDNTQLTTIYGYSKSDALKRNPEYDNDNYNIHGGWYID